MNILTTLVGMNEEDVDEGLEMLERCLDFAIYCYEQMGPNGVFILEEDFLEFFPDPVKHFGERSTYYDFDTEKMENKIPGTEENWENGTLGCDIRYARVAKISE